MTWGAIGAIGEMAGALAVLITLIYLARQIKESNRQNLLGAFQHWNDTINQWCEQVSESQELTSIILRGRASYHDLTDEEQFRFQHVHAPVLNAIESHYFQVRQTALDPEFRDWTIRNLEAVIQSYLDHPGTRELWKEFEEFYPPEVRTLVADNIRA